MNDDPSEVEVLYIKAHDESGCLQKISDEIANNFIDRGKLVICQIAVNFLESLIILIARVVPNFSLLKLSNI